MSLVGWASARRQGRDSRVREIGPCRLGCRCDHLAVERGICPNSGCSRPEKVTQPSLRVAPDRSGRSGDRWPLVLHPRAHTDSVFGTAARVASVGASPLDFRARGAEVRIGDVRASSQTRTCRSAAVRPAGQQSARAPLSGDDPRRPASRPVPSSCCRRQCRLRTSRTPPHTLDHPLDTVGAALGRSSRPLCPPSVVATTAWQPLASVAEGSLPTPNDGRANPRQRRHASRSLLGLAWAPATQRRAPRSRPTVRQPALSPPRHDVHARCYRTGHGRCFRTGHGRPHQS